MMEDWYKVTEKEIANYGGAVSNEFSSALTVFSLLSLFFFASFFDGEYTLLHKFGDSPSDIIRHVFKDHTWFVWKFKKLPQSFFRSKYVHWLSFILSPLHLPLSFSPFPIILFLIIIVELTFANISST